MYYAILEIGYGKRKRFTIRKVVSETLTLPAEIGKCYTTLTDAQKSAENQGFRIEKTGDVYQILP